MKRYYILMYCLLLAIVAERLVRFYIDTRVKAELEQVKEQAFKEGHYQGSQVGELQRKNDSLQMQNEINVLRLKLQNLRAFHIQSRQKK
jgi:hypothetical protein